MADNKLKGTFQFAANYEVTKADALDPRVRWDDWEQMIVKSNWPVNGDTIYLYKGLIASVGDEVWMLVDDQKFVGKLNTSSLKNDTGLYINGSYANGFKTPREIADFLGWKVVGADITIDQHILTVQK